MKILNPTNHGEPACLRLAVDIAKQNMLIKYARQNAADINEAGAYPYLAVYSRDLDVMYADAYDSDVIVF